MEKRQFEHNGKTYYIEAPSAIAVRESDWAYSKVYTKALTEGIPTSSEMVDILKKRGIIGPEYDRRAQELATMLDDTLIKMVNTEDEDEKRMLALKASDLRNEIFLWNQRFNGPLANTCEHMADEARLESLTSFIVVDEEGNRVWNSYDEFLTSGDSALASTAKLEVMLYLQGLESDFLDKVPEAETLRELESKDKPKPKKAKKGSAKKTKAEKKTVKNKDK